MGTLGQYLKNGREAREIDIRDAAQQTRISINYLRALEDEDFSKLPGEVFVRGFLKNYGRFLNLDEAEILKRYAELKPQSPNSPAVSPDTEKTPIPAETTSQPERETPIEPFIWVAVICISLLVFLFTSLPSKHRETDQAEKSDVPVPSMIPQDPPQLQSDKPEKLYLEVVALEDTWVLVRTDTSPQKKAVLKKGESLIWSADERFLLSYGHAAAAKLLLNGEELTVTGTSDTPVRDLAVTRTGVVNQPTLAKQPQPLRAKPKPAVPVQKPPSSPTEPQPSSMPAASAAPASTPAPASEPAPTPPAPAAAPAAAAPSPAPTTAQ